MTGEISYRQSDFKDGQKWRVIKDGQLHGMKPCGPWAQQGWSQKCPKGTVLTCHGVFMTFGDGVPVVKWKDAQGNWLANDCEFSPKQGGMWFGTPHHDHMVPTSPEIETLECHNYSINLREKAMQLIAGCMGNDAETLLARIGKYEGRWVAWDAEDDDDGFLLVGDDPWQMAKEAVSHFELEIS